jgi:hypothetical protein
LASTYILVIGGYLLPVPSLVLAWLEAFKESRVPAPKVWRRAISRAALWLLALCLVLWFYAFIREASFHNYLYDGLSAKGGRWGSLALLIISLFAETKIKRYLIMGTLGLLFFFAASIGDVAI